MKKKIFATFATGLLFVSGFAQLSEKKSYPVIGQPCPDFTLNDVHFYDKNSITLSDLKGKHVILDFWAKDCMGCIAAFPKWNSLQEKFKDKLQVILVGLYDQERNKIVKEVYEKYRKKFNLDLVVAFDSILFYPPFKMVDGVPWIIWIDDKGIVKAIPSSRDIGEEKISAFLSGRDLVVSNNSYDNYLKSRSLYNSTFPLYFQNNGGINDTAFSFRSILAPWEPGMASRSSLNITHYFGKGSRNPIPKYEVAHERLINLFAVAYTGKYRLPNDFHFWPVLGQGVDSALFEEDMATGASFYNYSLIVPKEKAQAQYLMKCMQNDLENYFGYRARVIERYMPCLLLKVIDKKKFEKIKSKPETQWSYDESPDYYNATNNSIDVVTTRMKDLAGKPMLRLFNETGFSGNIDIKLNVLAIDFNEVRKALNTVGLDIVEGQRKMKVLEIFENKF